MSILRLVLIAILAPLMSARPLIVGHRGSPEEAPENTLPSFQKAWDAGADAIEGDFHLTRDRKVVCIHDEDTRRFRGPKLTVRKTRLAELQRLDAGSWRGDEWTGTNVPTFAEVLATVPAGKRFVIEVKSGPRILRHLFREIDASGIDPSQLTLISFSPKVIKRSKQLRPEIVANLLASMRRRDKSPELEPTPEALLRTLKRIRADGLSVYAHPAIDAAYVAPILEAGYTLHVWTVNTVEDARRWAALGVSSITTNRPGLLQQEL